MDVYRERRIAADRRKYAIYYRYGVEHRANTDRRQEETSGDDQQGAYRVLSLGDIARLLSLARR